MARWWALMLTAASIAAAGCAGDVGDAAPAGPRVAIDVAALNLTGVGDAVWDLEVTNGAGQVVWHKRVSSSGYGDGGGSASYVGTCDAGSNDNTVKVWVVGVYGATISALGSFDSGAVNGATGTALPFQNPTTGGPLTRTVTCSANQDVAVRFDVALMRPAQQGFFDIAVNFNDIFCSAKLDCCRDTGDGVCDASEDLNLLFDAAGARARTIVLGFACTAGTAAGVETALYMDPLGFNCGVAAAGTPDFTVSPAGSGGNQCSAGAVSSCAIVDEPGDVAADDYLFQVAVYRGEEALTSGGLAAHKSYWNVALGVTDDIGDCTLMTRATADDTSDALDGMAGGAVTAGAVYPYVSWDVPLATCADEELSFDGTGTVRTRYTATGDDATAFAYAFAAGIVAAPVCSPACASGYLCAGPGTCVDIDECAVDNGGCSPNATCTNTPGAFDCDCDAGYSGDGVTCDEVDECAVANGGCSPDATCTNTPGGFTCECNSGFTGDGFDCVFEVTLSASTTNYDLFTATGSPTTPHHYLVTIAPGVTVSASSTADAAFRTGPLPSGSVVDLVNHGSILGAGGRGGTAGSTTYSLSPGYPGGDAVATDVPLTVDTSDGFIFGGGGGGGGGGLCTRSNVLACGGSGGGGRGKTPGAAGTFGACFAGAYYPNGTAGGAGTESAPGGGGGNVSSGYYPNQYSAPYYCTSGHGGAGGDWGQPGAPSTASVLDGAQQYQAQAGGAAGHAIRVNAGGSVSWVGGNDPTHVKGPVQ